MIIVWNSAIFYGKLIQALSYGIIVQFKSNHNSEVWTLVSVYGTCKGSAHDDFVNWLHDLPIHVDDN